MAKKKSNSALRAFIDAGWSVDLLYEAKESAYSQHIAELILSSESIIQRSNAAWEFKSLAEYGEEEFARGANLHLYGADSRSWIKQAIAAYSECIYRNAWYEEDEGLIFFVKTTDSVFRQAREGDDAYDYVCRLRSEGAISDLRFLTPPSWASDLFIGSTNLDVHALMWNDCSSTDDARYRESKKLKAGAVHRETAQLLGASGRRLSQVCQLATFDSPEVLSAEKSLSTRERDTLLKLVVGMAIKGYTFDPKAGRSNVPAEIASDLEKLGIGLSDDTVRKWLKEASNSVLPKAD
jgi:hypothetical protein